MRTMNIYKIQAIRAAYIMFSLKANTKLNVNMQKERQTDSRMFYTL